MIAALFNAWTWFFRFSFGYSIVFLIILHCCLPELSKLVTWKWMCNTQRTPRWLQPQKVWDDTSEEETHDTNFCLLGIELFHTEFIPCLNLESTSTEQNSEWGFKPNSCSKGNILGEGKNQSSASAFLWISVSQIIAVNLISGLEILLKYSFVGPPRIFYGSMVWKSEYLINSQVDSDALGQKISIWKPLLLVTGSY